MGQITEKEGMERVMHPRSKGEVDAPGLSPGDQGAALGSRAIPGKSHKLAKDLVSKEDMIPQVKVLKGGNISHVGGVTHVTPSLRTQAPYAARASHPAESDMTDLTTQGSGKRPRPDEADEEGLSPQEWKFALPKLQSFDASVQGVMTPKAKVHYVLSSRPMSTVVETLYHVSGAPVVDACDAVVGVISRSDLNRCKSLRNDSWRQDSVSKYMSNKPKVVRRNCKIRDAASLLEEHGIYRLPVVDEEEKLVGVVTRYDLIKNFLTLGGKPSEQVQTPKVYTESEKLEMLRQWVEKNQTAERRMPTSKENWLVDGKEDQPFGIGRWLNRLKGRVLKEFRKDPEASSDGQMLLDGPICKILGLEPGWWKGEERWERKLAELKAYMEKFGEIPRKSKDRNLYHFVSKQREIKQSGKLSEWRKKKLEEIPGWEWDDGTVIQDAEWEQKYGELEKFLNKNNKCFPTQQKNVSLYWFLEDQRRCHSKSILPRQRIDKLDALLGIGWWSKESQNDAQLTKTEEIVYENDIEEDEVMETNEESLSKETHKEEDEAASILANLSSFQNDKRSAKNPHKQPITDPDELKKLKDEGLTPDGEKRIKGADTRCRPSAALKNLFDPKFPEFRLPNAVSSAKAEDIVNIWAMLANVIPNKEVPFYFEEQTYRKDQPLMEELRKLIPKDGGKANPDPLKEFLKKRFKSRSLSMKRNVDEAEIEVIEDRSGNEQINPDAIKEPPILPEKVINSSSQQQAGIVLADGDRHSFKKITFRNAENPLGEGPLDADSKRPAYTSDETRLQQSIRSVVPDPMEARTEEIPEKPMEDIILTRDERLKALGIRWQQGHKKSTFQKIPSKHNYDEKFAEYDVGDGKGPRKFNLGSWINNEVQSYKRNNRTDEDMWQLIQAMHLDEEQTVKFWNRCNREKEKAKERIEFLKALNIRYQNGGKDPGFKEIPVQNSEEANAMYDLGDGKGPRKFNLGLWISTEIQSYKKGKRQDKDIEELFEAMELSEEARSAFWGRCKKDNTINDDDHQEKRQRKKERWLFNLEKVKEYPLPSEWPTKGHLGSWLRHQKKSYIDNTLASEPGKDGTSKEEKRRLLEELPGWSDHVKAKADAHVENISAERLREVDSRFNTLLRVLEEWKAEQRKVPILKRKHIPAQRDTFVDSETGESIGIGGWIQNYKKSAKNGVPESIGKLAEIGKLLGIGEKWWQSNSPPCPEEDAQVHTSVPMDQDEDIEIIETPENDNDVGVLPEKDTSTHESRSIPEKFVDKFLDIEKKINTEKNPDRIGDHYIKLAEFYRDLYEFSKDNVFKWALKEIQKGMKSKNYDDAYLTLLLISVDVKDNDLGKVIQEMRDREKQGD